MSFYATVNVHAGKIIFLLISSPPLYFLKWFVKIADTFSPR